ncbi:DUF6406 domain-containing protein [Actinoplanes sp. NPDC049668]|uniref:DUF6406 domain-containing protein n=1 Tax=unclassified Actinoplanes TaxID=2626549 RepID=UPI0033A8D45F
MEPDDRVVWVGNNVVVATPAADIGIMGSTTVPEPEVQLVVMYDDRTRSTKHLVKLGETFPIAGETWRLADIDYQTRDDYSVCLRRVDEYEPQDPPSGYIWQDAELQPYGTLTEAQITAAESELGTALPPEYRDWLARNNGAQPARPYRYLQSNFLMTPERPLFGLHPEYPAFDLVAVQRTWRDPYLTRDHLVIATPGGVGGLLAVRVDDGIRYLPPEAMTGQLDPADRVRFLRGGGHDITDFIASLRPYEPEGAPAGLIQPGDPGYRSAPG